MKQLTHILYVAMVTLSLPSTMQKIHNYVTIVTCVVNGAAKMFMLNRALKK